MYVYSFIIIKTQSSYGILKKSEMEIEMPIVFLCWTYSESPLWELTAACRNNGALERAKLHYQVLSAAFSSLSLQILS